VIDDLAIREVEVLEHVAQGLSNRAIAVNLGVSIKCVEKSITTIYRKLDLNDRDLVDRRVSAAIALLNAQRTYSTP
jgi:DNA-binding NarL/FixJ family response regulator